MEERLLAIEAKLNELQQNVNKVRTITVAALIPVMCSLKSGTSITLCLPAGVVKSIYYSLSEETKATVSVGLSTKNLTKTTSFEVSSGGLFEEAISLTEWTSLKISLTGGTETVELALTALFQPSITYLANKEYTNA